MPNFSSITICGHLGRDASIKEAGDSSVCELSIAVTHKHRGEKVTTWYRASIWGKRGETLAPMLLKGKAVIVSGAFEPRPYKAKDGSEKLSLEIRVDQLGFAGGGAGEEREQPQRPAPAPTASSAGYDDSEVPF